MSFPHMASMRPRPDAAENSMRTSGTATWPAGFNEAAARCRGKRSPPLRRRSTGRCFNEAAARCRGKPSHTDFHPSTDIASMRPRPDAAENRDRCRRTPCCSAGFNEAAARCRGKPEVAVDAAGRERHASMRPRPDAAENPERRRGPPPPPPASMRPRPDAAENTIWRWMEGARISRFNEAAARCRGKRHASSFTQDACRELQ